MGTDVKIDILLSPINIPTVTLAVADCCKHASIDCEALFSFEFKTNRPWEQLTIAFSGKSSNDATTAVIIKQVSFFGIADPRFVWLGQYTPVYPEPWHGQQTPTPPATLNNTDYLGWNGVWRLDFSVPVFTWIHQVQNLGWIRP
jgi:hypothetical protein